VVVCCSQENEYEAWKKSMANMKRKQKKKAVTKKFEDLQLEHKKLMGQRARGN
jgi:hypothetical protein